MLPKLWEDMDDTRRHQLTMIRISEQFAVTGEEKRRRGMVGRRPCVGVGGWGWHPVYQFLSGRLGLPS